MAGEQLKQLIRTMKTDFQPILEKWQLNHPPQAGDIPPSARRCLFDDVFNIGYVVFTADSVGQAMELRTLAQALALLSSNTNFESVEALEDKFLEDISKKVKTGFHIKPQLPKCLDILAQFDERNHTHHAAEFVLMFDKLLDELILQDGMVSNEELSIVKEYEKIWADLK